MKTKKALYNSLYVDYRKKKSGEKHMKSKWKIKEAEPDITLREITLLSIDEYENYKSIISNVDDWWWLRSPGKYSSSVAYVYTYSDRLSVDRIGQYAYDHQGGIRPVLLIEPGSYKVRDKIWIAGKQWTFMSPDLVLCDEIVGHSYYRFDTKAEDANNYDSSDIKSWLKEWWKTESRITLNGCTCIEKRNYLFENPIEILKRWRNNTRCKRQRSRYGFCERDVLEIDTWFVKTLPCMLMYVKKTTESYPERAGSFEHWQEILSHIIYLLRKADSDRYITPDEKHPFSGSEEDFMKREHYKNEAFALFTKWFYDLWE